MLKKIILYVINAFFRLFPIDNKKIVFTSTNYSATNNPYYVYKYINENKLGYKTVFIVSKNADVSGLRKGDYCFVRGFKSLYHLATYKYMFTCQSFGSVIKKRPQQVYIQLWHGIALKKMGLDVENPNNLKQLPHSLEWNYVVSSSEYERDTLKSSSGFTCQTKILGNPRTDALFEECNCDEIRQRLNIRSDKKIILYAPTFRDDELSSDVINVCLPEALKENFTLLIRLHPLVANKINPDVFTPQVINACNYPELNDLLKISDIVITDYSSVFFDFSLLNKPTIFYAYDFEKYSKMRNGFYLDYKKELPGAVVFTEQKLAEICLKLNDNINMFEQEISAFNKRFNTLNDGNVCKRILNELQNGGFDK